MGVGPRGHSWNKSEGGKDETGGGGGVEPWVSPMETCIGGGSRVGVACRFRWGEQVFDLGCGLEPLMWSLPILH